MTHNTIKYPNFKIGHSTPKNPYLDKQGRFLLVGGISNYQYLKEKGIFKLQIWRDFTSVNPKSR